MRRVWRIGLGLFLGLVVLGCAGMLWFVAMLSGGFDDLVNLDRPTESSPKVVTARERSAEKMEAELDRLVSDLGPSTGLRPSERVTRQGDWCDEGQHNWKIDDDYDLLCTADRTVLLLGEEAETQSQLGTLMAWLDGAGYRPPYEGAALELRLNDDAILTDAELGTGGTYHSADHEGWRIDVQLVAAGSPAYRMPRSGDPLSPLMVDGSPVDDRFPPSRLLPKGQYGVWLTLSVESFRD